MSIGQPSRQSDITERFGALIAEHRAWLQTWPARLADWESGLQNDPEAAVAEAWVRNLLARQVARVAPHVVLDRSDANLDFACSPRVAPDAKFYVEVTHLDTAALVARTGMPDSMGDGEGLRWVSLASSFLNKRRQKQCQYRRTHVAEPVVVALTALHGPLTFICFGDSGARALLRPNDIRRIDPRTGRTWRELELKDCMFFKPGSRPNEFVAACPEIAAVALFAMPWVRAEGGQPVADLVLNPTAEIQFDPRWLPEIKCWQFKDSGWQTNPLDCDIECVNI